MVAIRIDHLLGLTVAKVQSPEIQRVIELAQRELFRLQQIEALAIILSNDVLSESLTIGRGAAEKIRTLSSKQYRQSRVGNYGHGSDVCEG